MVANAGLDNEKSSLTYQVELLKDQVYYPGVWKKWLGSKYVLFWFKIEEAEEQTALVTRELREKDRDFKLLQRQHTEAQRAVQLLQVWY